MIKAEDCLYLVYRGNDDGDRQADGPLFWAQCVDIPCTAHGASAAAALAECIEAVHGHFVISLEQRHPLPVLQTVTAVRSKGCDITVALAGSVDRPAQPDVYYWCVLESENYRKVRVVEPVDYREVGQVTRLSHMLTTWPWDTCANRVLWLVSRPAGESILVGDILPRTIKLFSQYVK